MSSVISVELSVLSLQLQFLNFPELKTDN